MKFLELEALHVNIISDIFSITHQQGCLAKD